MEMGGWLRRRTKCERPVRSILKERKKKCRVYVGFIDLRKPDKRVNNETLCQVLRIYDVGVHF